MVDTEPKAEKAKKNRSAAYPSTTLSDAIEQLKQIHSDLGKGPYDRESAAKSLGYTGVSGASSSKIAALVHYGLIQRTGGGYIETDLGTSIALPVDRMEESKALLEAFKSPALFAKLLTDFTGKSLPSKLDVILTRQYRITEQASKDVARVFKESAEFVGVLKNGFLGTETEYQDAHTPSDARLQENTSNQGQTPNISSSATHNPSNDILVEVGPGLKVVFSQELMLQVATGKFSKGIGQLSEDLSELNKQSHSDYKAGDDEKVESQAI